MSMSDPIADLLTRIRNAQMVHKNTVECPASKTKLAILDVLKDEGYISGYQVSDDLVKPVVSVELKYHKGQGVIEEIHRGSRPGLRHYVSREDLPEVRAGLGVAIISTNKGVMTDKAARQAGVGGEILCTVF
ncbi:MAG: 30S ribosomal protein S8 [Gammaproteobacteria bacterium]|nr:30S ribosomal protein S8 [Gammaproteobacteria bacterium]MAY02405.1 30S ribosomal protein S8 [Gammaproteobacteria bacterium]